MGTPLMYGNDPDAEARWRAIFPTRSEFVAIVRDAAKGSGLRAPIKRKLTLYAKRTPAVVYGGDYFSGAACPLRAVGVERRRGYRGGWQEQGAHEFEVAYDHAMSIRVGFRGPCRIGVRSDDR